MTKKTKTKYGDKRTHVLSVSISNELNVVHVKLDI